MGGGGCYDLLEQPNPVLTSYRVYLKLQNMERLLDQVGSQERVERSCLLQLRCDLLGLSSKVHLPKALHQRVAWALGKCWRHSRYGALLEARLKTLLHGRPNTGDGGLRGRRPSAGGIGAEVVRLSSVCALLLLFRHGVVKSGGAGGKKLLWLCGGLEFNCESEVKLNLCVFLGAAIAAGPPLTTHYLILPSTIANWPLLKASLFITLQAPAKLSLSAPHTWSLQVATFFRSSR